VDDGATVAECGDVLSRCKVLHGREDGKEALAFYERVVALGDESYVPDVEACRAVLAEEREGKYDWTQIAWEALKSEGKCPHYVIADYNGGCEIRDAGEMGIGLFATRDFQAGELMMVEKATFCENSRDIVRSGLLLDLNSGHTSAGISLLAAAFVANPRLRFDLYLLGHLRQETVTIVKKRATGQTEIRRVVGEPGLPAVAPPPEGVFDMLRLERAHHNFLSSQMHPWSGMAGSIGGGDVGVGLWRHQPLINHGCDPNVYDLVFGDVVAHRAARPIKKDEQLLHSYFQATGTRDTRKMRGFTCKCPLCLSRVGDPHQARRLELYETLMSDYETRRLTLPVFERLYAEFLRLNPIAHELGLPSEQLAIRLVEAGGRREVARVALERSYATYVECGSMPHRTFQAIMNRHAEFSDPDADPSVFGQALIDCAQNLFGVGPVVLPELANLMERRRPKKDRKA
jgi:hypothetical protein